MTGSRAGAGSGGANDFAFEDGTIMEGDARVREGKGVSPKTSPRSPSSAGLGSDTGRGKEITSGAAGGTDWARDSLLGAAGVRVNSRATLSAMSAFQN